MEHTSPSTERGQTLVLVALMMVGLLAVTGLAIDGGTAFLERRRVQNAADAAAMAGAQDLVLTKVGTIAPEDGDILAKVRHFAHINGVPSPEENLVADYVDRENVVLAAVGGGSIPEGATGISTTVRIERQAHFMQVVGINIVPARAFSLAQTGPPDQVSGLRPFGLPVPVFDDLTESGGSVRIHFGNPNQCDPDDEANNVCYVFWDTPEGIQRSAAHRGWWNYNEMCGADDPAEGCSSEGGASDLKAWMKGGYRGLVGVGDRVCSKPGRNTSVIMEAKAGDTFCIPVYSSIGSMELRYDVAGFTRVEVTEVKHQGEDPYLQMVLSKGECPGASQAEAGDPAFNVYIVTQWE